MPTLPCPVNLTDQAARSINFLEGAVDRAANAVPYFWLRYNRDATWLQHNHWDHSENPGRFLYAAVLSRIVLGQRDALPVETCFKQQIFDSIPPGEGLSFRPNPSPYEVAGEAVDEDADQVGRRTEPTLEANLWDNRSVYTGLILNALSTGDDRAFAVAGRMVETIKGIAVQNGRRAWFTRLCYPPGYRPSPDERPLMGQNMGGWISPLVFHARHTGDDAALELAAGLSRTFLATYPKPIAAETELPVPLRMNVHALIHLIAGVVRVARATGEHDLLDWARTQFDAVLEHLSSRTGWTREFLPSQGYAGVESCETCCVADRVDAGIQLALAGFDVTWNDVQRCVLNYLAEAQFTDNAWMPVASSRGDDFFRSYTDIRERLVGAYVGWGAPNDLVEPDARVPGAIQNCCGPHGAFAVYQAWHHAVTADDAGVHVNLHLSRDTAWCSVVCHHPHADLIDVSMKTVGPLHVRLPDNVSPDDVDLRVNGRTRTFTTHGSFLSVDVAAGDRVEVRYPQRRFTTAETLAGRDYTFTWQGDYVVDVDPAGTVVPLFRNRTLPATPNAAALRWPALVDEIDW